MLLLASFSFSTEDSFSPVFKSSRCAAPLCWSSSAPHKPVFSCLNYTFAFDGVLVPRIEHVAQALPSSKCWTYYLSFSGAKGDSMPSRRPAGPAVARCCTSKDQLRCSSASLLFPPERDCSSVCIRKEGRIRHRRLSF